MCEWLHPWCNQLGRHRHSYQTCFYIHHHGRCWGFLHTHQYLCSRSHHNLILTDYNLFSLRGCPFNIVFLPFNIVFLPKNVSCRPYQFTPSTLHDQSLALTGKYNVRTFQDNSDIIGSEARTSWTQLLIISCRHQQENNIIFMLKYLYFDNTSSIKFSAYINLNIY